MSDNSDTPVAEDVAQGYMNHVVRKSNELGHAFALLDMPADSATCMALVVTGLRQLISQRLPSDAEYQAILRVVSSVAMQLAQKDIERGKEQEVQSDEEAGTDEESGNGSGPGTETVH